MSGFEKKSPKTFIVDKTHKLFQKSSVSTWTRSVCLGHFDLITELSSSFFGNLMDGISFESGPP